MVSPVSSSLVHPSARHCHCCTHHWTHSRRSSCSSTGDGIHTLNHAELPSSLWHQAFLHTVKDSQHQQDFHRAHSPGPHSLSCPAHAVWPCQIIQGHTAPQSLSPRFPIGSSSLLCPVPPAHAGPGGRRLPELSSPSSALAHGRWHQYQVKLCDPNCSSTKEEDASRYETEEDWKRTEPSRGPWVILN